MKPDLKVLCFKNLKNHRFFICKTFFLDFLKLIGDFNVFNNIVCLTKKKNLKTHLVNRQSIFSPTSHILRIQSPRTKIAASRRRATFVRLSGAILAPDDH